MQGARARQIQTAYTAHPKGKLSVHSNAGTIRSLVDTHTDTCSAHTAENRFSAVDRYTAETERIAR